MPVENGPLQGQVSYIANQNQRNDYESIVAEVGALGLDQSHLEEDIENFPRQVFVERGQVQRKTPKSPVKNKLKYFKSKAVAAMRLTSLSQLRAQ
jgi:hypothetical protein